MPLSPGKKLAHYEIVEPIGKGGMGEVYRARDSKLGRDVAIKVLPDEFAQDEERLKRFQREAKVLASLNHPNIASIYGLELDEGIHYLVLELVEGETLAQRIARGAIPVAEALEIAKQITEALEEAHEQRIVHRDLKPANIKITPDGKVKVLDFGLAKAFAGETPEADSSMSPTLTRNATQMGVIMGTAAYMSPEQARGRTVDTRADVWAFGVVLYEMLTGRRPFHGEDVSLTLAAVMTFEPDFEGLPDDLSPLLKVFLARCLDKDPKRRVQAIGDMRLAIEGAFAIDALPVVAPAVPWRRAALPWATALGVLVVAIAVSVSGRWEQMDADAERRQRRFTIDTVEGTAVSKGVGTAIAVSPDGETVVYLADSGGGRQLYRRSLAELEATLIQGTQGARMPVFSPDGQWLAFNAGNQTIKRVALSGGEPFTVCTECEDGSWGDNGSIVFERGGKLGVVPDTGGQPGVLIEPMPEQGVSTMSRPSLLPGATAVLFEIGSFQFGGVGVFSLESEQLIVVTENATDPIYSPTGHILFARERTLFAVAFDLERFRITGQAMPVLSGVRVENGGSVQAAISRDGLLVYIPAGDEIGTRLVWVDRSGQVESALEEIRVFYAPRISPNGQHIAVQINDGGNSVIWIYHSGMSQRLTDTGRAANPVWTPDV